MSGKQELGVKIVAVILSKARSDAAFKTKLLANPNAALADLGIPVPDGVTIKFVEDTATLWNFVIPGPRADGELADADLDKASGGLSAPMQMGRPGHIA